MREFPHFAVWALSLLAAAVLVGCVKDSPGRPSPVPAKKWVETAPAAPADMSIEELLKAYRDSLPELKKPEPRPEKSELADELARRAPSGAAELAVSLHDEGHDVRDLLEALAIALHHEIEYEDPDTGRRGFKKNPLFIEVTRRLGWQAYREPENFRMFQQWNFREFKPYQKRLFELTREYRGSTSFSQAHIDELRVLERPIIEKGNRILADHEKDRFAINAREAYVRFCERNNAGPVNRAKNKRMFSPRAMGRETEQVEEIWDYCYAKPFVLYVERPLDVNEAEFASRIDSNTELLQALHTWFMVEFVEKFELKRVKPIGPGGLGKDGVTGYSTGTERAEADGWPLEIVILKDAATYETFLEETFGRPMPGARAHYEPLGSPIVCYDSGVPKEPEQEVFNHGVLLHEAFHMLSDHYAANPHKDMEDRMSRARYASVLVQEGLADAVAGFEVSEGEDSAGYEFLRLNNFRLRDFKAIFKGVDNKVLFRLRDLVECMHYGQISQVGFERWKELGRDQAKGFFIAQQGSFVEFYYAHACQAVYFLHHYEKDGKHPYRKMWWEFVRRDFRGEIDKAEYDNSDTIRQFKEVFGIESDADWDRIEAEFLEFTLALGGSED